jgi:hypothetical protein
MTSRCYDSEQDSESWTQQGSESCTHHHHRRTMTSTDRGLLARFAYEVIPAWVQGVRARQAVRQAVRKQHAASWKAYQASEAKHQRVLQAMKGPEGRWVDQLIWPY